MKLSAVVAMSENRVIGIQNKLPWHLPEDLKHFKKITLGHSIIMGRKTFESIGRPLPGRENIIITRNKSFQAPGAVVVSDLEKAIEYCSARTDEAFVIGGMQIYQLALPRLDRIYLTLIHQEYQGDAYLPEYDPSQFKEISREDHKEGPVPFSYILLERK